MALWVRARKKPGHTRPDRGQAAEQKFWSHQSTLTQPPIILPPRLSHQGIYNHFETTKVKVTFSGHQKIESCTQPRILSHIRGFCCGRASEWASRQCPTTMSSSNLSAADFGSETESDNDTSPKSCTAGSNDNIGARNPLKRCVARIRRRLRVCVRACVRVCDCACERASMHACVRACVRACVPARRRVRVCVRACVRVCVCARVRASMHACVRACVRACVPACVCVCVRKYDHTCSCILHNHRPTPGKSGKGGLGWTTVWRGPCLEDALKYLDESGSAQCSGFKWLNDGKEKGKTQGVTNFCCQFKNTCKGSTDKEGCAYKCRILRDYDTSTWLVQETKFVAHSDHQLHKG